ncbi:hypothetical protein CEXT_797461 [Caerostris extrusa]|uniref:Secreted protein n=1 Tax=Caerostris extrusa TaxID=172846 RepID=A0AAV4SAM8_CAEEX|nr:hypothetical protein CEXT_797461 [Caerostris extrusa]
MKAVFVTIWGAAMGGFMVGNDKEQRNLEKEVSLAPFIFYIRVWCRVTELLAKRVQVGQHLTGWGGCWPDLLTHAEISTNLHDRWPLGYH